MRVETVLGNIRTSLKSGVPLHEWQYISTRVKLQPNSIYDFEVDLTRVPSIYSFEMERKEESIEKGVLKGTPLA